MPEEKAKIMYRYSRKTGEFGPPIHDENKNSYRKRHFWRGFNWGFLLSTTIFYQYGYYTFCTTPALFSKRQLLVIPMVLGACTGVGFGIYEVMLNQQKTYKPKVYKLDSAMGKKLDEFKK